MAETAVEKVKVFLSSNCGACQEVKRMLEAGKFNLADVEIIDVSTKEGFPMIEKLGLTKVPTAMKGNEVCKLLMDDESLIIDCNGETAAEQTP